MSSFSSDVVIDYATGEMYYNTSNISNISNTSQYISLMSEMGPESADSSATSSHLLTSTSSKRIEALPQRRSGNVIAEPDEIEWIVAQWAWARTRARTTGTEPERLRITTTMLYKQDLGRPNGAKKITFSLTNRFREFTDTNPFQKRIKQIAQEQNALWIGKARLRQPRSFEGKLDEIYRRNIPDLVMAAWVRNEILHTTLYTPDQTIELVFDQPISEKQRALYKGEARYGRVQLRARPVDDFYDWKNYA